MTDKIEIAQAISRVLGWIYTLSWSASFYPQPMLNWKRKSTHGSTIDFPFLNVVGFSCYTISISCFIFSSAIREQYAARHPLAPLPTVQPNDFAYGAHALVILLLTYSQFYPSLWGFDPSIRQRVSRPIAAIAGACALGITVTAVLVVVHGGVTQQDPLRWAWIDLVYAIGYVKLVLTFVKYVPQAWLNYERKSTAGWSISQILLDVLGGILSMLQLAIDASVQHNWKDVVDNPVKLGLSYISIFFDLIFITQHFWLYRRTMRSADVDDHDVRRPLLRSNSQGHRADT